MTGRLLVDVDGAAELLTWSRRSVERLSASGELPSVKIGRSLRFRVTDLIAFVESLGDTGAATSQKVTAHAGDQVRNGHRRK